MPARETYNPEAAVGLGAFGVQQAAQKNAGLLNEWQQTIEDRKMAKQAEKEKERARERAEMAYEMNNNPFGKKGPGAGQAAPPQMMQQQPSQA